MYHYTYLIQHKTLNKRYIGVRSSVVPPSEDRNYWGSSKHLPENIQVTHSKIILREFSTRSEAVTHEILLHDLNDVAVSDEYYNKAKQTTTKFDTSGTTLTDEHKAKCSEALRGRKMPKDWCDAISKRMKGRIVSNESRQKMSDSQKRLALSEGYVNPRQGTTLPEELRTKISEAVIKSGCNDGTNNNRFKPWFITYKDVTHLYYSITKEDKAIEDGLRKAHYQDLATKSKGTKPIKRGKFKGMIIGNIPT